MNKSKQAMRKVLLNRFKEVFRKKKNTLSKVDKQKVEVAFNRGVEGLEQVAGILLPMFPSMGLGKYAVMYDQVQDIQKLRKRGGK